MKYIFALIIFFSAVRATCQDTTYMNTKWETTERTNAEYYRVQIKEDSTWTRSDYYFANNQLQMKGNFASLSSPAIKHGYFEWYHKSGQLKHKGNYKNGKEIGEHLWYFENENLEAKETYQSGLLNGIWEEYHSNGNKSIFTSFKNGVQNGYTQHFREDGTKHSEGDFLNGKRDKEWKYFNNAGEYVKTVNYKTQYEFQEANMKIRLPNNEWRLSDQSSEDEFIFSRNSILDSEGRAISPAIMLYIEDASKYDGDATVYSIHKRQSFLDKGIVIYETYIQSDEQYPMKLKNGFFMKASYTSGGLEHILFMVHLITDTNKGIQLYLDMTQSIADEYEEEFWTTLKSVSKI